MSEVTTVPDGLVKCDVCGGYKGVLKGYKTLYGVINVVVSCLCDGILCENCETNKIYRPISNYYNPLDGQIWHVPYFAQRICDACRSILKEKERRRIRRWKQREVGVAKRLCKELGVEELAGIYEYVDRWPRIVFVFEPAKWGNGLCFAGYEMVEWKFGNYTVSTFSELRQIFPKYVPPREEWLTPKEWINKNGE